MSLYGFVVEDLAMAKSDVISMGAEIDELLKAIEMKPAMLVK